MVVVVVEVVLRVVMAVDADSFERKMRMVDIVGRPI